MRKEMRSIDLKDLEHIYKLTKHEKSFHRHSLDMVITARVSPSIAMQVIEWLVDKDLRFRYEGTCKIEIFFF